MEIDYKNIGLRIRENRLSQQLTQETLSELAELTPTHISHIERGTTKLSLPTLIKISKVLNVSVDYLLAGTTHSNSNIQINNLLELFNDCTIEELDAFYEICKVTKDNIRKF